MKPVFAWHIHHKELLGVLNEGGIQERRDFIHRCKPDHERGRRIHLLKEVTGQLPEQVIAAWQDLDQAHGVFSRVPFGFPETEERRIAQRAYAQAQYAYKQALWNNRWQIDQLHTAECPDCPWDGETIFPVLEAYA